MTWTTRRRSKIAGQAAIDLGDGPYHILMLHGVGLRAEAWSAQIDAFAATARVVAPDMPGHGQSGLPASRLTLTDYVNRCRIDWAKRELLKPEERISEIAFMVGYQSLSQFNRSFARIVGQSPTVYRRERLAKAAS